MTIFISYKSGDRRRVDLVVSALREVGFDVWWDRDIPSGAPWEASIQDALRHAQLVLVLWTIQSIDPHSGAKVQVEAREGLSKGKLIQLALDDVEPPLFFRQYQAEKLLRWSGLTTAPEFMRLIQTLRTQLGSTQNRSLHSPKLFTLQNVRRLVTTSLSRYYVPPTLAILIVGSFVLASEEGRQQICGFYAVPLICFQPYAVSQLPDTISRIALKARETAVEAEKTAVRARLAEAKGRVAAKAAALGENDTKLLETDFFVYSGQWLGESATGYGSQLYKTASPGIGEEYIGQFQNWVRMMGVYVYPPIAANTSNVLRYEGEWAPGPKMSRGNWNGRAAVQYLDGSIYLGQVKDGKRQGLGTQVYRNGERAEGLWDADLLDEPNSVRWKANGQLLRFGTKAA